MRNMPISMHVKYNGYIGQCFFKDTCIWKSIICDFYQMNVICNMKGMLNSLKFPAHNCKIEKSYLSFFLLIVQGQGHFYGLHFPGEWRLLTLGWISCLFSTHKSAQIWCYLLYKGLDAVRFVVTVGKCGAFLMPPKTPQHFLYSLKGCHIGV